jgi:hypothetical protein
MQSQEDNHVDAMGPPTVLWYMCVELDGLPLIS